MTQTRRQLTRTDLAPLTRAALGPGRTLTGVERLRGGTKKGVYRLTLDDDSTAVAYVWSAGEDYWDQPDPDPRDVFSHGTGLDLFTAAHDRLAASGVRTPRLLYADATHTHLPADAAVVEDVVGGSLEDALARDPGEAPRLMDRMADLLATLHSHTGPASERSPSSTTAVPPTASPANSASPTAPCAVSRKRPGANPVPPPYAGNWRTRSTPWPPRCAPATGTPSSTPNWARTTSCSRPTGTRRSSTSRA